MCNAAHAHHPTDAAPLIVMAADNEESNSCVQLGLRDMLLGWDEQARLHFRAAVTADADCALGWAGLMLTEGATAESRDALERVLSDGVRMTPAEESLLSTWLRLARGDRSGAGEEFAERAARFRNDILSACWAVLLLHDGYEEIGGKPFANQRRALEIAQQLYERRPGDGLVSYLRAWVEEAAPVPSETALEAARQAAEVMPEHPATQLLYGHFLFRNGQIAGAISALHKAAERAGEARRIVPHGTMEHAGQGLDSPEFWPLEIRAKLYESSLLWIQGKQRESLLIQSDLMKMANQTAAPYAAAPGAVLLHWEARTLPLRLLMLAPKVPSDAQIAAATKASLPQPAAKRDPVLEVRDCLRFCLVARQRAAAGKVAEAIKCIKAAELSFQGLEAARERCAGQGPYILSAWTRAHEACQSALFAAKAAAYPDTSDVWLLSLEKVQKPATMLMPPVLPHIK